jgi:hypothetical protein
MRPLSGIASQNAQIRDGIRHPKPKASTDAARRDQMHVFARHFGDRQFGRSRPNIHDCEIIGKRHGQFVDRGGLLAAQGHNRHQIHQRCRVDRTEITKRLKSASPRFGHSSMKFLLPCEFEIPDAWCDEAGIVGFRATGNAYQASSTADFPTAILALVDVAPPKRQAGVRWFYKDRMVSILKGMVSGSVLPPIKIDRPPVIHAPHTYRLRDGFHRFYASVALGFSHLPVSELPYFDINDG